MKTVISLFFILFICPSLIYCIAACFNLLLLNVLMVYSFYFVLLSTLLDLINAITF